MYGMPESSHNTGMWEITSMGEMLPARMIMLLKRKRERERKINKSQKRSDERTADKKNKTKQKKTQFMLLGTHPFSFFRRALTTSFTPRLTFFALAAADEKFHTGEKKFVRCACVCVFVGQVLFVQ
jgi:hypothetical protein